MKKNSRPQADTSSATEVPAIISPVVDFLCTSGISIFVVAALLLFSRIAPGHPLFNQRLRLQDIVIWSTLINLPHFMASYRLLYRSREQITEHRWSSTYFPIIYLVVVVYALLTPSQDPATPEVANGTVVELVTILGSVLLAWHYTAQSWGMTASFAYISGVRMDKTERRLIRSGYYALLVWHVLWSCLMTLYDPEAYTARIFLDWLPQVETMYHIWTVVAAVTILPGIYGFWRIRSRTGQTPPLRSIAPWVAIYMWYALVWVHPVLFVCLQVFHALQYMIFPIRVEVNQYARKHPEVTKQFDHAVIYYIVLVFIGGFVDFVPFQWSEMTGDGRRDIYALSLAFVNIHHYLIDGAIWKLRNPKVRKELFAHLTPT